MDYFTGRARGYLYAVKKYPNALANELSTAVNMCDIQDGDIIINIPGACVDILPYITKDIDYRVFETNEKFAELAHLPICTLGSIPIFTGSADKVLSLASLHHCSKTERIIFYKEVSRILKPGGTFILGDVRLGSAPADWLNIFVNNHNPLGHNGVFLSQEDIGPLTTEGFSVSTVLQKYRWEFEGSADMIDFCRHLFGLIADDTTIMMGLIKYLGASNYGFDWELMYFISKVPPTFVPSEENIAGTPHSE
jgi:SAM-dependent methyltransferase